MKFNPTFPQVLLLAVLLAAVIVAHVVAPLAVSAVTSMVSTIIGALFVNFRAQPDSPPPAVDAPAAPVLRIVPTSAKPPEAQ